MTFIAGIKLGNSCVLSADNMATFKVQVDNGAATTLGQALGHKQNDSAFKIYTPLSNCTIAVAGYAASAKEVIEKIKDKNNGSILSLKKILSEEPKETNEEKFVTLLIAFYEKGHESPDLFKWSNQSPDLLEPGDLFYAGSGSSFYAEILKAFFIQFKKTPLNDEDIGAMLSATLNQGLAHAASGKNLAEAGVGGCFFSITLDFDLLKPQEDTAILYIELIPKVETYAISMVKLAYRKGVFYVNNPLGGKKVLVNSSNCEGGKVQRLMVAFEDEFDYEAAAGIDSIRNIEVHFRDDQTTSFWRHTEANQLLKMEGENLILHEEILEKIREIHSRNLA